MLLEWVPIQLSRTTKSLFVSDGLLHAHLHLVLATPVVLGEQLSLGTLEDLHLFGASHQEDDHLHLGYTAYLDDGVRANLLNELYYIGSVELLVWCFKAAAPETENAME